MRVLVSNEPNVGMVANTIVAIKQIRIGKILLISFSLPDAIGGVPLVKWQGRMVCGISK